MMFKLVIRMSNGLLVPLPSKAFAGISDELRISFMNELNINNNDIIYVGFLFYFFIFLFIIFPILNRAFVI